MKYNSLKLGIFCSVLLPVIIFSIVFLVKFNSLGYCNILSNPLYKKIIPRLLSLAVYPNLLLFYLFLKTNRMLTVKGVLIGTILMALIVLLAYLSF